MGHSELKKEPRDLGEVRGSHVFFYFQNYIQAGSETTYNRVLY